MERNLRAVETDGRETDWKQLEEPQEGNSLESRTPKRVKVLNQAAEQRKLKCRTQPQGWAESGDSNVARPIWTEHTMFAEQTVEALRKGKSGRHW
mgnify:FL=1